MIIKRIEEGTFDSSPVHSLGSLQPLLIFLHQEMLNLVGRYARTKIYFNEQACAAP